MKSRRMRMRKKEMKEGLEKGVGKEGKKPAKETKRKIQKFSTEI